MKTDWKIAKNEQGRFAIFRNEVLMKGDVPEKWLAEQLATYGFCGAEFEEIREKLRQNGIAVVEL